MKRQTFYIICGILALIIACFMYLAFTKSDMPQMSAPIAQEETATSPAHSPPQVTPHAAIPGSYQVYTPEAVASYKGTKILFFHAPWCPQCRELEASIKTGTIPDNVTIFKVDYDSNQVLRQKYGVTLQTTLVKIDETGNMLKKFVAYSEPSLQAVVRNLLP